MLPPLAEGVPIQFNASVSAVSYGGGPPGPGVQVTTSAGQVVTASLAVVTVPLGVLKRGAIAFSPPLPAWKQEAIDAVGFGRYQVS